MTCAVCELSRGHEVHGNETIIVSAEQPWFPHPFQAKEAEAVQNIYPSNFEAIARWCGGAVCEELGSIFIPTPEGVKEAKLNDWIVRSAPGEFSVEEDLPAGVNGRTGTSVPPSGADDAPDEPKGRGSRHVAPAPAGINAGNDQGGPMTETPAAREAVAKALFDFDSYEWQTWEGTPQAHAYFYAKADALLPFLAEREAAARGEAIADFVNRQSVAYRKHSGNAIEEDIVLAVREFGVNPAAFYDDPADQRELRHRAALSDREA